MNTTIKEDSSPIIVNEEYSLIEESSKATKQQYPLPLRLLLSVARSGWINKVLLVGIFFFSSLTFVKQSATSIPEGRIYVQTMSGRSMEAVASGALERDDYILRQHATEFLSRSFVWKDSSKGVAFKNITYPTGLFDFSLMVHPDIQMSWLKHVTNQYESSNYPVSRFINSNLVSVVQLAEKQEDIKVEDRGEGLWGVTVTLYRRLYTKDRKPLEIEKMRYYLELQAISPFSQTPWGYEESPVGQYINTLQSNGLIITYFQRLHVNQPI